MSKKLLASLLAVVMVISLLPATVLAANFSDTNGHWGQSAINRWADVGILSGKGDGNFDPNGTMTRAEFAQMLSNMMGYTTKAANVFTDVPSGAWYEDAMLKLMAAGVIQGNGDGTANPNGPITREQAAVMLCRAFDIQPSRSATLNYADSASISSWARDAMAALAERGMMNGVGDNTAAPLANINRASVATLADNMIAEYVTESKTITGRVDGIILVAGGVSVNLDNATVSQPVIVAPKASGVNVNLTGTTTADDIVVEANGAKVNVGAEASASSVVSSAPNADITVSGKVDSVEVAGSNNSVSVSGTVGTVTAEAPNTNVTVSGTVNNVDIASSASRSSVNVTASGKVDSVATDASNVSVSGNGTVGSVTSTGGSVDVTTKGTEVSNQGGNATASGKSVESGSTATSTGTSGGGSSSSSSSSNDYDEPANDNNQQQQQPSVTPGEGGGGGGGGGVTGGTPDPVVAAPLEDHPDKADNAIPEGNLTKDGVTVTCNETTPSGAYAEADHVYEVTVSAQDIMLHTNASEAADYWLGIGMLVDGTLEDGSLNSEYSYSYSFKNLSISAPNAVAERFYKDATTNAVYNTIYFDKSDIETEMSAQDKPIVITQTATPKATTEAIDTLDDVSTDPPVDPDGQDDPTDPTDPVVPGDEETGTIVSVFVVTFDDVTFWNAAGKVSISDPGEQAEGKIFLGTVADVSSKGTRGEDTSCNVTIKLNKTNNLDGGEAATIAAGTYYYGLEIDDSNIGSITNGSTARLEASPTAGEVSKAQLVVDVTFTSSTGALAAQTFTLKDKAGRDQGTITVTIDLNGYTVTEKTVEDFAPVPDGPSI